MSGANAIIQQLLYSGSSTSYGVGLFFQTLLKILNAGGSPPIIVEHMDKDGASREMMFGRQSLSTSFNVSLQKQCYLHALLTPSRAL